MVKKGDRAIFKTSTDRYVGVITSYHFCNVGTICGYPEGDHWRASMRCDPGQYDSKGRKIIEVEGNVSFFELSWLATSAGPHMPKR